MYVCGIAGLYEGQSYYYPAANEMMQVSCKTSLFFPSCMCYAYNYKCMSTGNHCHFYDIFSMSLNTLLCHCCSVIVVTI